MLGTALTLWVASPTVSRDSKEKAYVKPSAVAMLRSQSYGDLKSESLVALGREREVDLCEL